MMQDLRIACLNIGGSSEGSTIIVQKHIYTRIRLVGLMHTLPLQFRNN